MNTEYIKVNNLSDATHWIPTKDEKFIRKFDRRELLYWVLSKFNRKYEYIFKLIKLYNGETITLNQPYILYKSNDDEEIIIINNVGHEIDLWRIHNGFFVKEVVDN